MYRITYVWNGPYVCDYIYPGAIRTLQFCSNYAYTAFDNFCRNSDAKDVVLEVIQDGEWNLLKTCPNK